MRFELIERLFDLPALMIDPNERLDGILPGIKQGSDQTNRLAQFAGVRMLDAVLHHPGGQRIASLMFAIVVHLDQRASIMQAHPGLFVAATIQPAQHVGSCAASGQQDLGTHELRNEVVAELILI